MKHWKSQLNCISLLAIFLISTNTFAEETENDDLDRSGGFLKIGLGYKFEQNPYEDQTSGLSLFVNGRYQMDMGLFIEAAFGANKRQEGLNIGYNFYNTGNWSFDITTAQAFGDIKIVASRNDPDNPTIPITATDIRDESQMLGFRATTIFDDTNIQFLVAPLLLGNDYEDGIYSSFWVGKLWQVRNWELYASAGLEYRSKEIISHYFSPSEALQTVGFPDYQPGSGIDYTLQVNASYPLSENLVFESYARYKKIANSITDSPIIQLTSQLDGRDEAQSEFGILISYVF